MAGILWKTADTKEVIEENGRTVYLLLPNGQKPVEAKRFSDIDAYAHLCEMNLRPDLSSFVDGQNVKKSMVGLHIEQGYYFRHKESGSVIVWNFPIPVIGAEVLLDRYEKIEKYEKTLYQMLIDKTIEERPAWEILTEGGIRFPLKLSFNPNAVYEELSASEKSL